MLPIVLHNLLIGNIFISPLKAFDSIMRSIIHYHELTANCIFSYNCLLIIYSIAHGKHPGWPLKNPPLVARYFPPTLDIT
jgi:hypothetical protein